jgi:hypothetical protein
MIRQQLKQNRQGKHLASLVCALAALTCLALAVTRLHHGAETVAKKHRFLLPAPRSQSSAQNHAPTAIAVAAPTPSTHWATHNHGQCCEGNLAAQGNSTYVLLPILVTGNQIWRSDDGGVNWTEKYPPVNASIPFGIEGDLQAFGNDVVFFGTQVADGICARSTDRGDTWTAIQIPVAFPANDQAWSYMGPYAGLRPGGPLPTDAPYVLTGWYRIGSVALFSFDGGLTWPLQTPLVGDDGSGPDHIVCQQTATPAATPGADTRIPDVNFINHKSGHHGAWGTDKQFYWTQTGNGDTGTAGNFYVCKTNNFGATWSGTVHPIVNGDTSTVVTFSGFDNKGTFYVLIGQMLYVSFDQGQSFAYSHQLPVNPNGEAGDLGANAFFVVNCGTIQIAAAEAAAGGNNIWYLRGTNVDTANPAWDQELVDVVGTNRLDFMQIILNGNNIPTISYTAGDGTVVTASRDAPLPGGFCLPCETGVVSRKTHGSAGTFDIPLALTGSPTIEPRQGQGTNHDQHQLIIQFCNQVTVSSVTASVGTVTSTTTDNGTVTINLTAPNGQCDSVTLHGVNDGVTIGDVTVPICFLLGDTNGDGFVNSADIGQTKSQSGHSVTNLNFREDLNTDGFLNSADIGLVKSKSGTALP